MMYFRVLVLPKRGIAERDKHMRKHLAFLTVLLALLMGCAQPCVKETDFLRFQNTFEQQLHTLEEQLQEEKTRNAKLSAEIQAMHLLKANQAISVSKESPALEQYVRNFDQQLHSLERQLQEEKTRNARLSAEIQAMLPPKAGQTISVNEVIAMPEQYANKDIVLEGILSSQVYFDKGIGHFVIQGLNNNYTLHCFFKRASLDQLSRRMLVGKLPHNRMHIQGQLVSSVDGFAKELGSYYPGGYEFHVDKILE